MSKKDLRTRAKVIPLDSLDKVSGGLSVGLLPRPQQQANVGFSPLGPVAEAPLALNNQTAFLADYAADRTGLVFHSNGDNVLDRRDFAVPTSLANNPAAAQHAVDQILDFVHQGVQQGVQPPAARPPMPAQQQQQQNPMAALTQGLQAANSIIGALRGLGGGGQQQRPGGQQGAQSGANMGSPGTEGQRTGGDEDYSSALRASSSGSGSEVAASARLGNDERFMPQPGSSYSGAGSEVAASARLGNDERFMPQPDFSYSGAGSEVAASARLGNDERFMPQPDFSYSGAGSEVAASARLGNDERFMPQPDFSYTGSSGAGSEVAASARLGNDERFMTQEQINNEALRDYQDTASPGYQQPAAPEPAPFVSDYNDYGSDIA